MPRTYLNLTVNEFAELAGMTPDMVRRLIKEGHILTLPRRKVTIIPSTELKKVTYIDHDQFLLENQQ